MLNGFAAQHDDKRLVAMGINIGNGMAKTLNQLGTAFLHGAPSVNGYS
ncbi:amino acid acetyltransferase [Pantoea sp. BRM17]|nr:amino acid acetyltransferase [Pantoea sp. BRM17]